MSLYRKYRPQTFEEVLGNEAEIQSLQSTLEKKNGSHVFLLSGPSGCGKTTLARIASKHLGADSSLSSQEINSSNNRGIETAREIIDQLQYSPPSGIRIYIIDEVHKTTNDWQNAMLKPLEDTPEHTYFFLCTTNPEKLIKAIRTRCTEIKVQEQKAKKLYRYLRKIAEKENFNISNEIIEEISENSNGSPRQALVLLEKVSELTNEKDMLKIISMSEDENTEIKELCQALLYKKDWKTVSNILKGLKDVDVETIRYAVLGYMNAVLLNSGKRQSALIIELFSEPFYNSKKAGLSLACYQCIN
jgi:DNA polymerase III gamma/tau subunit